MTEATGSTRRFRATALTDHPDGVWRAWTTPGTWGGWDAGLRSASLTGPFAPGNEGEVVDRSGRRSRFVVEEVHEGTDLRRCSYAVILPGARLVLTRTLTGGPPARLTHEVAFVGPLGAVWGLVLGPGFRRRLGPTVDALVASVGARS